MDIHFAVNVDNATACFIAGTFAVCLLLANLDTIVHLWRKS